MPKSADLEATRATQQQILDELKQQRQEQADQAERRSNADAEMLLSLEDLEARIDRVENQLRDLLDGLSRVGGGAPVPPPGGTDLSGAPNPDPRSQYEAAYLEVTRGNYDLAVSAFEEFLRLNPSTDLSDNAVYWIGESYYAQEKYDQATEAFVRLMDVYPDGDKVPAAMLKLGYAFIAQGDTEAGCRYLQTLVDRFPSSEEAGLAKARLSDC